MGSALNSTSSGPGSSYGRGHCVVFMGKTLDSHSASLHPSVEMGTDEFNAGTNLCDGLASHPRGSRNTWVHFLLHFLISTLVLYVHFFSKFLKVFLM